MKKPSVARGAWLGTVIGVLALAGCAPNADQSGWEIARKKSPAERLESFPEIPVVLPGAPVAGPAVRSGTPMEAVRERAIEAGSLFRRGYSAPTP